MDIPKPLCGNSRCLSSNKATTMTTLLNAKSLPVLLLLLLFLGAPAFLVQAQQSRERLSLNSDWRFQKGDPPGKEGQLTYERVRPWVIATGNEFVKGVHQPRPAANLGGEMIYTDPGFDDRGWRQLNLPTD